MREKYQQLTATKESIEKHKLELEAIVQQKTSYADALEKEVCIGKVLPKPIVGSDPSNG